MRACEPSYDTRPLSDTHIAVIEMPFPDGSSPSNDVLGRWLDLVEKEHRECPDKPIAVHCVAGLGRAPVLVAVALIEKAGLDSFVCSFERYYIEFIEFVQEAIEVIRKKRRGAINTMQLKYLEGYKRMKTQPCCTIL